MRCSIIEGDLLDQDVDVIVNAWNRNVIPQWLLLPQGVSEAIKRRGGPAPFQELRKHGAIPLGGAVLTSAGELPFKGIIHVAANRVYWGASEWSIRQSVRSAMGLAAEKGFKSIAFPLPGVEETGFRREQAKAILEDELGKIDSTLEVRLVTYRKAKKQSPWWFLGFQLIFICLIAAQGGWRRQDYFHNFVMGACVLFVLIMFVYQFIKQQAQYTIKTLMIATFVVAVFCSIYKCFGFDAVFWLILIVYMIICIRAANWAGEGKNKD